MVRILSVCTAALPVLVTVALGWGVLASALTLPGAGDAPLNMAEAAGLGSAADVLRRLGLGEDPRAVLPVRPDVISSSVLRASAVEAAVWSRQVELVKLLDRWGAFEGDGRSRIGCLARDLQAEDIAAYLGASDACPPNAALEAVLERTHVLTTPTP
jgi:hypothetical protein